MMKFFGCLGLFVAVSFFAVNASAQELANPTMGQLMPPPMTGGNSNGMPTSPSSAVPLAAPEVKPEPLPPALQERNHAESMKPQAREAWMRPAMIGRNGAVYMDVIGGAETDVLKSISTAWAERVEIHQTVIDEQGVARMSAIPELPVASESKVAFAPRGLHVMVMGLKRDLSAGQIFPLLLNFEKAGEVRVMVTIRAAEGAAAEMPMLQHEHHHADMPAPVEAAPSEAPPASSTSPTPEVSTPAHMEHAH